MTKILILCTGNSCRSQMAHGFLKSFGNDLDVHSAGTNPSSGINANAIRVMKEIGIDISDHKPENVDRYLGEQWDFVITVCDNAREKCPYFSGNVKQRLHMGFDDPSEFRGSEEEIYSELRRIRDEIRESFLKFYNENLR